MVKAYLRYAQDFAFGLIASRCNGIFDKSGTRFITAVLEGVAIWKARNGEFITLLTDPPTDTHRSAEVKCLSKSPTDDVIAAGYSDGTIKLYDLNTHQLMATYHGHKRAITSFCFSPSGKLLVSGSQDTAICVWDLVSETGLFKLKGHTNEITGLCLMCDDRYLISGSKDGQLKLWELNSQHCWQTLLHERGVIWSLAFHPLKQHLIVGSIGPQLQIYDLVEEPESFVLKPRTTLTRKEEDKAHSLVYTADGRYLACKNASNVVEIFKYQSQEEAQEHHTMKRNASEKILKKLRKESKKRSLTQKELRQQSRHERKLQELSCPPQFTPYKLIQKYEGPSKILSIDFRPSKKTGGVLMEMGITLSSNSFEIVTLSQQDNKEDDRSIRVHQNGHSSGIRTLCLSSNDDLLLSLSDDEIKIWKSDNGSCIHSLSSGEAASGLFAPGDNIVVIGTKFGKLEVFDLHSSTLLESIAVIRGPIWSLIPLPDQSGFISGGVKGHVKFWNWGLKTSSQDQEQVTIKEQLNRALELNYDVMSMKISPNGEILALALLDATIRLFYLDSLSVYLTLYGHKLPVYSIDISADSQLLISGSADKNIKIWGMDFGNFAFVHTTHYFFSVGKDRMLKYWDADKFQLLLELPGHHSEVNCLVISQEGEFLFTGSNDRSLKKWSRLEEPFFLEEEQEKRREQLFDQDLLERDFNVEHKNNDKTESFGIAGQKTVSSINAADSIIEALELTSLELKKDPKEAANPLLLGLEPEAFVLRAIQNIKSTDLEMALLSISFSDALMLLKYLAHWLKKSTGQMEMLCKVTVMLIRLHLSQLASSPNARSVLIEIQANLRPHITHMKNTVGFNLEGIKFIRSLLPTKQDINELNEL
eukprot:g2794.t1